MRIGAALIIFFLAYTYFWIGVFSNKAVSQMKSPFVGVLSASGGQKQTEVTPAFSSTTIPTTYSLTLEARKQKFNLSCEFAAASAILYHFTKSPAFLAENQESAEKMLMAKIGVSQNPNIGIRMGFFKEEFNDNNLYTNLNEKFGGSTYYGVHAPPFIDLFNEFGLAAQPLPTDTERIKKAIASGHLVMTWLHVGYGQPVDVALSYGDVSIIRGEHTVVIYGYDQSGVFIMDPGNGNYKYASFDHLLNATQLFSMPFLEVYPSNSQNSIDPTGPIDSITKLDRSAVKVLIKNGTKEVGVAQKTADILKDFGYTVLGIEQADNLDYLDVAIRMKKSIADYTSLFKKDLRLAQYTIANLTFDMGASESADVVVTVGR